MNGADATSDGARSATWSPVALERKRTEDFPIPKPESRLKHPWEFIYKQVRHIYRESYLISRN